MQHFHVAANAMAKACTLKPVHFVLEWDFVAVAVVACLLLWKSTLLL
jgi:hypothetical protein